MRSRTSLFALFLVAGSLVLPVIAHAQGIPFFGPIIPEEINRCAAGWGSVIVVINRIIAFLITIAIVFIAPLTIAYAGFLMVINQGNASTLSEARGILLHTVIGIIIALSGWLIVDALMAVLYNPGASSGTTFLTKWSQIITADPSHPCLVQESALQDLKQVGPGVNATGVTASGTGAYVDGKPAALCVTDACNPVFLQSKANFTPTQSKVMSCIALTENSGNATGCNGNACGTFQIMLTVNPLVGPACGGTLNCPALCKGNGGAAVKTDSCKPCVQAANDATCNAQAAQYLYSKSGYGPWTTSSDNKKSGACVQQYANG